ncbi:glycosyltransferase [Rothia mucilaginosa]|jgi:putative glycosyltransferase protein|uniref:glycosyltransferase n=1 Tax=Rothia mucilaginosa TaxID=43675 RepID=UPI00253F9DD6|nr:glycosyltransferase [Rothia mucilaginosa]
MKVKNIVIAQDRFSLLGGITTVNRLLGRAFEEAGYNVSYLALYDNTGNNPDAVTPDFVVHSGDLVLKTTHNKLAFDNPGPLGAVLAAKKGFTALWDRYNAARTRRYQQSLGEETVILTTMTGIAAYLVDYARSAQKQGIGYLYEFHSSYDSSYRLDAEKELRQISDTFDSFIALSEGDAQLFAQWLNRPVDAVSNLNASLDPAVERKVLALAEQKKPTVQFIGRYSEEKGLMRILESFIACATEFPEWILKLNGSGDEAIERQVKERIASLDSALAERIVVGGPLNSDQVLEAYAEASLTIGASDFEGSPMSLQEAMRVGTPMVSYPSCWVLRDVLPQVGYLAQERSIEALTEQLRVAMGDDAQRAEKSARCFQKAQEYTPEHIVRRWEEVFASIKR